MELPVADPVVDLELRRSIWQLYGEWAAEAEQVYARARSLEPSGIRLETVERLDDAIGRVSARLSLRPEQVANAKEQVRQGQTVLAKELTDELHARLRT